MTAEGKWNEIYHPELRAMKLTTIPILISLLAVTFNNSASARGGGAAAGFARGGAGAFARGGAAAVPRGAPSIAAMPRGAVSGGASAALRAGAAGSMLRASKGSAFANEVTLAIETYSGHGTLSIRGSSGILRNSDGTFVARLRTSANRVYFYEADGTLRGYAEEFMGTVRLYRVSDSGGFVFEASEPIAAGPSGRSLPHTEAPESDGSIVKIGSRTVWNAPDGKWEEIHETCGRSDLQCIASRMREAGASSEAIAFTEQMKGDVYLSSYREMGKVDLGTMTYPLINDPNVTTNIMVNGVPLVVDPWDGTSKVDIRKDKNYKRIARRFPKVELWPMNELKTIQSLPQNGQRFIFSFLLLNGCRGCDIAGGAQIAFDFDGKGRLSKTTFVSLED